MNSSLFCFSLDLKIHLLKKSVNVNKKKVYYTYIYIVFKSEVTLYNDALKAAGYNDELIYTEKVSIKKKTRKRTIIWFNPPWNDKVNTNVARKFLAMID